MKSTLDYLREGRALIATKGWTQGQFARDDRGAPVGPASPRATCFCGLGAILAVRAKTLADLDAQAAAHEALRRTAGRDFALFNDAPGRTVDDVLAKFDAAIAYETPEYREGPHDPQ